MNALMAKLEAALKHLAKMYKVRYIMVCEQDYPTVLVGSTPAIAREIHEKLYDFYALEPRIHAIEGSPPMTALKLLKECKLVYGSEEEVKRDIKRKEEELKNLKLFVAWGGVELG